MIFVQKAKHAIRCCALPEGFQKQSGRASERGWGEMRLARSKAVIWSTACFLQPVLIINSLETEKKARAGPDRIQHRRNRPLFWLFLSSSLNQLLPIIRIVPRFCALVPFIPSEVNGVLMTMWCDVKEREQSDEKSQS